MRDNVPCEFPAGYDGTAILKRLEQVLDPELDESILDLGFVRSLQLRSGHASVALRLPASWCAVNFAYMMADDVRRALLNVEGIRQVTVRLGEVSVRDEGVMVQQTKSAAAQTLQRYLERRAELGLDCSPVAALIVDLDGKALSAERLHAHYEAARTVRVAMEANGSFCRALLSLHRLDAADPSGHANTGGRDV